MERLLLSLVSVSLVACSSSHVATDDGGPPLADGGAFDDAGSPITSCAPESFALRGEGCFCSGPIVLAATFSTARRSASRSMT